MADSTRTPAPGEIIPVEGWELKGEHGHMAFDTTKAGRLVRLADLVQWLIDAKELPCGMAVEDVCEKLQAPDAAAWLYMVTPGKMARPLTWKDDFSWHPIIVGSDPAPDPADCGIAGAVRHMRSLWGSSASPSECEYIGANYLDPLSIRMDKAHALWDWGSVSAPDVGAVPASPFPLADFAALVAYRKAQKAANVAAGKPNKTIPWTGGNQLDLLRGEYARLGGQPGAAVQIAKALETTRQAVVSALEKKRKRKAPSPLPSLGTSRAA
ncbi:MAG TPA: hypothetical protein VIP31_08070 [Acidovorax sp.]